MVNLTRIYTRTGDTGTTALGDMSRVAKTDPRISAYADANEANAALGTVDIYIHRLKKYIGAYYAVLGRVDAVAFTAGVG
ncbi:hypothetical protein ABZS63_28830, partial [Streptomyces sp. NPDC005568]